MTRRGETGPAPGTVSGGGDDLNRRKKVLFAIHYLAGGGAERVILRILGRLSRDKFVPVLLVLEDKGEYRSEVPRDVRVLNCGRYGAGGRWIWLRNFVQGVRKEKPDVIVSFLWFTNVVAILCRFLSRVPCRLILSERSTILGSREGILNELIRRFSIRFLYPVADRVIPNSQGLREQLTGRYRLPAGKVTVIQNPLDIEEILVKAEEGGQVDARPDDLPVVLGIGRLSREKGFDLLIGAVAKTTRPFRLVLLGEGPSGKSLRDVAGRLGVADRVEFVGFQANPYAWLRRSAVFVLPSRYEGFPNSLLEAMALGVPCIATRCPTGPEEIVTDGEDGLLVPVEDCGALAAAIDRLLGDPALRERLGDAARETVRAYDAPKIVRRFEALVEEVAG